MQFVHNDLENLVWSPRHPLHSPGLLPVYNHNFLAIACNNKRNAWDTTGTAGVGAVALFNLTRLSHLANCWHSRHATTYHSVKVIEIVHLRASAQAQTADGGASKEAACTRDFRLASRELLAGPAIPAKWYNWMQRECQVAYFASSCHCSYNPGLANCWWGRGHQIELKSVTRTASPSRVFFAWCVSKCILHCKGTKKCVVKRSYHTRKIHYLQVSYPWGAAHDCWTLGSLRPAMLVADSYHLELTAKTVCTEIYPFMTQNANDKSNAAVHPLNSPPLQAACNQA